MSAAGIGSRQSRAVRGRLVVLAVFLVFFVPIVVALWLNVQKPGWLPIARSNHGIIVRPARTVAVTGLEEIGSAAGRRLAFERRWTIVLLVPGGCDEGCLGRVSDLARVRIGLGRDAGRVQRLVVLAVPQAPPPLLGAARMQPDLHVAVADAAWTSALHAGDPWSDLYVVDPRGFLVLRYPAGTDLRDVQADLQRLLRISEDEPA